MTDNKRVLEELKRNILYINYIIRNEQNKVPERLERMPESGIPKPLYQKTINRRVADVKAFGRTIKEQF
jgi:hypothetical protein